MELVWEGEEVLMRFHLFFSGEVRSATVRGWSTGIFKKRNEMVSREKEYSDLMG